MRKLRDSGDEFVNRISWRPGTEVLPGWSLVLRVTEEGYVFTLKDQRDLCGFFFTSDHFGVIRTPTGPLTQRAN